MQIRNIIIAIVLSTQLQAGAQSTTNTLQTGTNSTLLKSGTESTLLKTDTESTLLKTGTDSTLLKTGTASTTLQTGTVSTLLQAGVTHKVEPMNILILLDCSNTMQQALDGTVKGQPEEKLAAAKDVLKRTLHSIPPDVKVGLRIFGNNFRNDLSDCKQSFLLVPIGTRNRGEIVAKAEQLHARGMTPLTYALAQAASDFDGLLGGQHIVLISDGFETCGGDPCKLIQKLTAIGFKMKIDVVGVGLKHDLITQAHLKCITESSGGKYFEAETAAELAKHVNDSMMRAVAQNAADAKVSGLVMPRPVELKAAPSQLKLSQ